MKLLQKIVRDLPELFGTVGARNGKTRITNQAKLDELTQDIVRKAIGRELEIANDKKSRAKPRGRRNAALYRQSMLWAPFSRKSTNVAIIRNDGSLAASGQEKADELGGYWGETSDEKVIDIDDAREFLKEYVAPVGFESLRPPDQSVIEAFLARARHSAPGPYGLPYGAWGSTGSTGSKVLSRVLEALCAGIPPSDGFNESLGIFPARGVADDDSTQLLKRAASDTRPLSCKNTDNKTLARAVNDSMAPNIAEHADDQQEGFTKEGRA